MAERHKREAKLNRGRKAKNKGREVLPNTKKSTSTEVINQEHKEIIKWFQTVKFRRTLFGGVDENDVWKKLQELNLSLIHISEPTRLGMISYAVFCLKKKK